MNRMVKTGVPLAGLGLVVLVLAWSRQGEALPSRQSFEIAAGPVSAGEFAVVELIARLISHPPGLVRCDKMEVCGPPGLIVSTRSSEGAVANVLAVERGQVSSGLAPGNIVADAVAGRGAFRKAGLQRHIRVIASLFPETLQLVVAARSKIKTVRDLRGKRVSLGREGSGDEALAKAVLAAAYISRRSVRLRYETGDTAARLLGQGKLDAFFHLGPAPSPVIAELAARGAVRLVPIDGRTQSRLLARQGGVTAAAIAAGTYGNAAPIRTVGCRVLWIVRDTARPATVYGLVRALYHPANRGPLASGPMRAGLIRLDQATRGLTAPLDPGAARYYRAAGVLPPPGREAQER